MKKFMIMLLSLFVFSAQAQDKQKEIKTVTFKVLGNCEQCKDRIENAADIKGVKTAKWSVKTQVLTVTYRADKTSEEQIKQAVLNAGHDVESEKAPEGVYKKLPACCKYREGKHGM